MLLLTEYRKKYLKINGTGPVFVLPLPFSNHNSMELLIQKGLHPSLTYVPKKRGRKTGKEYEVGTKMFDEMKSGEYVDVDNINPKSLSVRLKRISEERDEEKKFRWITLENKTTFRFYCL